MLQLLLTQEKRKHIYIYLWKAFLKCSVFYVLYSRATTSHTVWCEFLSHDCFASISPLGEWKMLLFFRVNAVFGWMPCHNFSTKNWTYLCTSLSTAVLFCCFDCFVVSWLLFYSSQCQITLQEKKQNKTKQKKTKKAFAFLFDTPVCICCCFASAILHSSWKGSCLIQGGDAKWLEWRSCCQTQIIWENQDALDSPFLAADCLHLEGLQLPGKVNQANV